MTAEPRCPQCGTVVLESWDWCHGCGFDPDGIRAARWAAPATPPPAAPAAPPPPPPSTAPPPTWTPPTSPPPPGPSGPTPPPFGPPPGWAPPASPGPVGSPLPAPPGSEPRPGGPSKAPLLITAAAIAAVIVVVGALVVLRPTATTTTDQSATAPSTTRSTPTTPTTGGPSTGPTSTEAIGGPVATETPPEMYTTPADPALVVDTPTAVTVLEAFWPVHVDGWARHDPATIALVETGAALQTDSVECLPSCPGTYGPIATAPMVTAPHQSSYPAFFAAQLQAPWKRTDPGADRSSGIDTYLIVFTRQAADQPWLAAIVVANGSATGVLTPSTSGIVDPPTVTGAIDPRSLPDQLAAYYQSYRYEGQAPADTPFHDNGAPAERGMSAWRAHQKLLDQGVTDDATYRSAAAEDGYFEVAAERDTILACSTIRWTTVNEPQAPGGVVTVTKDGLFQAFVPPGDYARIERDGVLQSCFTLNTDCSCLTIVGIGGGPYVARTEPA